MALKLAWALTDWNSAGRFRARTVQSSVPTMQQQEDELDHFDEDSAALGRTFLTFVVGDEAYAVPVHHVTEIVRLQRSFALPDVPSCIRGVINLRGKIIPLLDVRVRFGMQEAAYTDRTVVVVLEWNESLTGLVVDAVSEVIEIAAETIEPRPAMAHASSTSSNAVSGIATRPDGVIFMLELPTLLQGASKELKQAAGGSIKPMQTRTAHDAR